MCMASTRAHAGWFTRCCVELPSTNPTNTVQKQYKHRPTTVQQPYTNRTQTVQKPVQQSCGRSSIACTKTPPRPRPPDTPGYALRDRKTKSTPWTPRAAPVPPPATLRYGAAGEAGGLPEGPPPRPQDPKGGAGTTPRHTALRRGEGGRWPTRRAAPTPQVIPAGPQGRRHLRIRCSESAEAVGSTPPHSQADRL